MNQKTILVLGACGGVGRVLCRQLLASTDASLVVAGRSVKEVESLRDALAVTFPNRDIRATFADATDRNSLMAAFAGVTLVVDATTAIPAVPTVARAALDAGCDFLDFHFEQRVVPILQELEPDIRARGRCFITQAGFHPGLPAAFVRHIASRFDTYTSAVIGMAMNTPIEKPESIYELVDVLADYQVDLFSKGVWRRAGYTDFKSINFGSRFGTRMCYPLQMEEMYALPTMIPTLQETGVYVAGFNWFVDYLVFPLAFMLFAIRKGLGRDVIARLLVFGLNRFGGKERGVSFVLDAVGTKGGTALHLHLVAEHEDAYLFTAVPVAACIAQYLDGTIATPGLHLMGHVIQTDRLMTDMQRMGIAVQEENVA